MEVPINIFYLDKDPVQAAIWAVDRHCVKMILESAQLLSTAHRVLDGVEIKGKSKTGRKARRWVLNDARENILYAATHINHPSAVWCRQSVQNYEWLVEHFFALMMEYNYRYDKQHKCYGELSYMLQSPPKNLQKYDWTEMPSCMAEEYIISDDPIINYRNYYKIGKSNLHSWKNRQPPEWINQ
jgi:hypothetical protein